jgi:hypothetical protein
MIVYRGTIQGLSGNPTSGLWFLNIDGHGIPIESGFGVRQLAAAFGATEGTGDLLDKIVGQEIVWSFDELGMVLGGFTPYKYWEGPDIPEEGLELDEKEYDDESL